MVQCLLDLGADPNAANRDGLRPVYMATAYTNGATARCLLEAGQYVEIADHKGRTPLHVAAQYGIIEIVTVLLEMGADILSIDLEESTPLQYASYTHRNQATAYRILHLGASMVDRFRGMQVDRVPSCQLQEPNHVIIEMLLAAWADIAKPDYKGDSPLRWATGSMSSVYFRQGDCNKSREWYFRARPSSAGDSIA